MPLKAMLGRCMNKLGFGKRLMSYQGDKIVKATQQEIKMIEKPEPPPRSNIQKVINVDSLVAIPNKEMKMTLTALTIMIGYMSSKNVVAKAQAIPGNKILFYIDTDPKNGVNGNVIYDLDTNTAKFMSNGWHFLFESTYDKSYRNSVVLPKDLEMME